MLQKHIWKRFLQCEEENIIDLDYSIKKNINNLAEYKNKKPKDLTACILDRPRHKSIINDLRDIGVKLNLSQMEMYQVHF